MCNICTVLYGQNNAYSLDPLVLLIFIEINLFMELNFVPVVIQMSHIFFATYNSQSKYIQNNTFQFASEPNE